MKNIHYGWSPSGHPIRHSHCRRGDICVSLQSPFQATNPNHVTNLGTFEDIWMLINFQLSKGPIIEVQVGRVDAQSFMVHEPLLRSSSPYFDRMLCGNWKEAREQLIKLPEDKPTIFAIYMAWLYQKKIATVRRVWLPGTTEFLHLVQAYTFGDMIQAKSFQNSIIDAIFEKRRAGREGLGWFERIPDHDCVNTVYQNTCPGSPLRRLLVDLWIEVIGQERFNGPLPGAFLKDMIKKLWPYARTELARTCTIRPYQYYVGVGGSSN